MARNGKRLIVGLYGDNRFRALEAFETLRATVKSAWIVGPEHASGNFPADLNSCRETLLADEYLVAGFIHLHKEKVALEKFRANGEHPTFILGGMFESAEPRSPHHLSAPSNLLSDALISLAATHSITCPAPKDALLKLFNRAEFLVSASYQALKNSALLGHAVTPTGEWLLDNNYLFEVSGAEIKAHLPKKYGPNLPGVAANQNRPRIYAIACELTKQLDFAITETSIAAALEAYQLVTPLNVAELWLFPVVLRLALYEGASRVAARAALAQDTREYAYFWTNRLVTAARVSPEALDRMLGILEKDPLLQSEQFINVLAEQLHEEDIALARFQERMANLLRGSLSDLVRHEHQAETADRITVANAIGSLRTLGQIDFTDIFVLVSRVERILNEDPARNYSKSDFSTRDECRRAVEELARESGLPETEVARSVVRKAAEADGDLERHVAFYLLGGGRPGFERQIKASPALSTRLARWVYRHPTLTYSSLILFLTGALASVFAAAAMGAGDERHLMALFLALAAAFPLSEFSIQIVNTLIVSTLKPSLLPRMDFEAGIPEACTTLVAVPMMLVSLDVVEKELEKLETRFVGNVDDHLHYALLADFTDSPDAASPDDEALLQAVRKGIDDLRRRYSSDRFHLFHREREWSESEEAWIGKERKRGKIEDLNALLCGEQSALTAYPSFDSGIAFVITLDSDTGLPAGSARKMVEAVAHPLNRVRLSEDGRHRLSGYTIIQPRISIGLSGTGGTRFSRIYSDARGTDPYCQAVSDLYQDLFHESTFHGKAIYDVCAMHAILRERFPAHTILSHDLIEGAHVGVAADTKIELFEGLPDDYGAYARRQHRWIRGDWQISPWIRNSVPNAKNENVPNPLPLVNRWQVFDNLRRSLVAPFSLLILCLAWLFSGAAGISSILIAVAAALPSLAPVIDRLAKNATRETQGMIGVWEEIQRTVIYLILLPHQAWISVDAIGRVLYRRHFSKHRLLEWQTAEAANISKLHLSVTIKECLVIAAGSIVLMLVLSFTDNLPAALPFLILWASSPLVVVWLGGKVHSSFFANLSGADEKYLRVVARRTWRTFDDLVGPDSKWLPPDNTQVSLRKEVAQRTSPTNVGLWFTSLLAAYDFGFVTPEEVLERCQSSVSTLNRMDRYEGHWLNWYSLETLDPLFPRYVSTVDSGNLLVCFWVLAQGLKDIARLPALGPQCLSGMAATLEALAEVMGKDAAVALPLNNLRQLLRDDAMGYEIIDRLKQADLHVHNLKRSLSWFASQDSEASYWVRKLELQCNAWQAYSVRILGYLETLAAAPDQLLLSIHPDMVEARFLAVQSVPSLRSLPEGTQPELNAVFAMAQPSPGTSQSAWLDQLTAEYRSSQEAARKLLEQKSELIRTVDGMASTIDMGFLYDGARKLFGIGYEVGAPKSFTSHYDLLASECRLASLAAIAKGDVPSEHWQALGRPYVSTPEGQRLLSWTGTMFEYLMPVLFMKPFENTLLAEAARLAVQVQRAYADDLQRPWGISEAAYSALDANQIYQYRAFGVQPLGLKPGLENDLVVSPYSTLLALQIDAHAATENLRALAQLSMYGPMGFYESIDFSRPSGPSKSEGVIIYAYMAHHQGMGLTALANALLDSVMQRRFHENLRVRSVESLLFERVPAARSLLRHTREDIRTVVPVKPEDILERNPGEVGMVPNVQLLGNGEYSVMLTNAGSGYSRWLDTDIGRWQSDTTLDSYGTFFYVRDLRANTAWSPSLQPIGPPSGAVYLTFSASRVKFDRSIHGIEQSYEICVAPDDSVEIRRFVFSNRGIRTRHLDITSYLELALAQHTADRAHPAFSKMFVQTEWLPERLALVAQRRPRSPEEAELWAGHMLVTDSPSLDVEYESSRGEFLGRNRTTRNPQSLDRTLTATVGTVLDPVFAVRCRFSIEAREKFEVAFLTMAARSRVELLQLMDKYAN